MKIILGFLLLAVNAWATYPDANTVAYWPLASDGTDASGNGYNAVTFHGTPARVCGVEE